MPRPRKSSSVPPPDAHLPDRISPSQITYFNMYAQNYEQLDFCGHLRHSDQRHDLTVEMRGEHLMVENFNW